MEKNKNTCSNDISNMPETIKCHEGNYINRISNIKYYPDTGRCYDELDNYLGIGTFKGNTLTIEREK